MSSSQDKVGMTLDEIIQLGGNSRGRQRGNGAARRGRGMRQGDSIRRGPNTYRQPLTNRFQNQRGNRGRGFYQIRGQYLNPGRFGNRQYGGRLHVMPSRQMAYFGNSQNRLGLYQKRVRRAAQVLNMRQSRQQQPMWRLVRPFNPKYQLIPNRGRMRMAWAQSRQSFEQIQRLKRHQLVQNKSRRPITTNSVYGGGSDLTVSIANDRASFRKRAPSVIRTSSGASFSGFLTPQPSRRPPRDSASTVSYLNRQSLQRLDQATGSGNIVVSPNGSIITTISRRSNASSRRRNNRFRRSQSVASEPPTPQPVHCRLNPQLQREIAAIQGKTTVQVAEVQPNIRQRENFSVRPTPFTTGTSLNERFSIVYH